MSAGAEQVRTADCTTEVVCHCYGVLEGEIQATIDTLPTPSLENVVERTCAGTGCTACHYRIRRMLEGKPAHCGVFAQTRE